jgi:ATP-dependent helicase HrpB
MGRVFPVDSLLPDLVAAVRTSGCAVLQAPPGAGKTTRVPPALLDAFAAEGRVVVLEPRRIAARAAADYVARQRQRRLGDEVGYQVRFERVGGRDTALWFVTEGVLSRRLASDPFLDGVAVLILDEFHERHLHGDVALAVACELRRTVRPDLKLVVMSATIDAAPVARHLGDCPVLTSEGRRFPVEIRHAPAADGRAPLPVRLCGAVQRVLLDDADGDLLVFLPGVGEIRRCAELLEPLARRLDVEVLALHGNLPLDEQQRVLRPSGRRRVVLATNVAETALTIDGVTTVIDGGLARVARYDAKHGINRIELVPISRASAEQRAGRAGRTAPGRCIRLWSEAEQQGKLAREAPEIARLDLTEMLLLLRSWELSDPRSLPWLDPPPAAALDRAEALLAELGATTAVGGALTGVGRRMLRLAAEPRLARVLVEAERLGHGAAGCLAAALASERDIRLARRSGSAPTPRWQRARDATLPTEASAYAGSDLVERAELFLQAQQARFAASSCQSLGLDRGTLFAVDRARRNFAGAMGIAADVHDIDVDPDALRRSLLAGFPDRVVRRRAPGSARGLMVGGTGVVLDDDSAAAGAELYVAFEIDHGARGQHAEARVRLASAVEPAWLAEVLPANLATDVVLEFDAARQRVVERRTRRYLDLPLDEVVATDVDRRHAGPVLAAAAMVDVETAVTLGDAERAFLDRVGFVHAWLPDVGVGDPQELLAAVVESLCTTRCSFAELRRVSLLPELRRALPYEAGAVLEREAPESYALPSGRMAPVCYRGARPPMVEARVQELFGLTRTPRLARGRAPLVFEILAPNMRAVQITEDLTSFWNSGYPEVRKQLRGRYPKHDWPEDPLTATPTSRAKRRREG